MTCNFPGCTVHAESNAYCVFHQGFASGVSVKLKKEVNKESNKMKADKRELKKIYAEYLSQPGNKYCKVKMEGCTKISNVIHHVRGRIGDQVFEIKDWLPSCASCNIVLESKDAEARAKGVKKSKFTK